MKKKFDAIAFKDKVQAEIYEEIKDLSIQEEIDYFRKASEQFKRQLAVLRDKDKKAGKTKSFAKISISTKSKPQPNVKKKFDCVDMKHKAQARIYEETKDLSNDELIEYFNKGGQQVWREIEALREKNKKAPRGKIQKPDRLGRADLSLQFPTMPCITSITPTICKMMDIPIPSISEDTIIDALCDSALSRGISKVDKCFVYAPDAIGSKIFSEHRELFEKVLGHAPINVQMTSVFPSVTPVAFASMFTGAMPERHGITKYNKPVLQCDTLFDALIRAKKNPAIVAVEDCSISLIFRERKMDYFIEKYDEEVTSRALQLIEENRHDFILAYNQEYDDALHKTTPYSDQAINALINHINTFDRLAQAVETHWAKYNRMIMFTPDHGAHIGSNGQGTHGDDIPDDMLINHFFGVGKGK